MQLLANIGLDVKTLGLYIVTLFGSLSMYVFSLNKGLPVATPVIKKLFRNRSESFYDWSDLLVVVVFGSIIGSIVFHPQSALPALAAGFGWVGAVSTLVSQRPHELGSATQQERGTGKPKIGGAKPSHKPPEVQAPKPPQISSQQLPENSAPEANK